METWKPVPNFPEYEVSKDGLVRSWAPIGKNKAQPKEPRIKKHRINRLGYCDITFFRNGVSKTHQLHRLVALCFLDGDRSLDVAHLDGNPLNNRAENLRYSTKAENAAHKRTHGTHVFGKLTNTSKACDVCAAAIKSIYLSGKFTNRELGKIFNMSAQNIASIGKNKTWTHLNHKGGKE